MSRRRRRYRKIPDPPPGNPMLIRSSGRSVTGARRSEQTTPGLTPTTEERRATEGGRGAPVTAPEGTGSP